MAEVSLNIKIGNRVYPLSVEENEVDRANQAANLVNGNIEKLKKNYGLNDGVDLLAMTAFELANHNLEGSSVPLTNEPNHELLFNKLNKLQLRIEEIITLE